MRDDTRKERCIENRAVRRAAAPLLKATKSSSSVDSWRRSAPETKRQGTSPWPRPGPPSKDDWVASAAQIAGRTPATSRTSRPQVGNFPVLRTEGECFIIVE